MGAPLTYLGFHAVFVIPPIVLLGWLAYHREGAMWGKPAHSGLAIIIGLAVLYTTPWTNMMIPEGVWWYADGTVIATIWHTPLEEYMFFILQPLLTGFWLYHVMPRADLSLSIPTWHRAVGAMAGLGISVGGWWLMATESTFYLGSLLWWSGPILAIQWAFGITYLVAVWRRAAVAIGVPTLYLWVADWTAIELGIWVISSTHTTGYGLAGLPIEEALFFLCTNVFIVQGVVLYVWVVDQRPELFTVGTIDSALAAVRARIDSR